MHSAWITKLKSLKDNFEKLNSNQVHQVLGLSSAATKEAVESKRKITAALVVAMTIIIADYEKSKSEGDEKYDTNSLKALINSFAGKEEMVSAVHYRSFPSCCLPWNKRESGTYQLINELTQHLGGEQFPTSGAATVFMDCSAPISDLQFAGPALEYK